MSDDSEPDDVWNPVEHAWLRAAHESDAGIIQRQNALIDELHSQVEDGHEAVESLAAELVALRSRCETAEVAVNALRASRQGWKDRADRLAAALQAVTHDRPTAHSDAVWEQIKAALAEWAAIGGDT